MNTEIPTPRTDAAMWCVMGVRGVSPDFARQLERELTVATQWQPIETAPRDLEPIDIWSKAHGRLCNYQRVELSAENWFYKFVENGVICVRDATHWKPIPPLPSTWSKSPIHEEIRQAGVEE